MECPRRPWSVLGHPRPVLAVRGRPDIVEQIATAIKVTLGSADDPHSVLEDDAGGAESRLPLGGGTGAFPMAAVRGGPHFVVGRGILGPPAVPAGHQPDAVFVDQRGGQVGMRPGGLLGDSRPLLSVGRLPDIARPRAVLRDPSAEQPKLVLKDDLAAGIARRPGGVFDDLAPVRARRLSENGCDRQAQTGCHTNRDSSDRHHASSRSCGRPAGKRACAGSTDGIGLG